MPPVISDVLNVFAAIIRLLGMLVLGFGVARLALDMYHKGTQTWQLQAVIFLGFVLLLAALADFTSAASLGGFGLGAGIALLLGLNPKKEEKIETP
jgi:uncharacterized membrane protein YraQ (UPF0718 family)